MPLLTQADLAGLPGPDWRRGVLDDLSQRLSPPSDFPCTFSQNAFRRQLLQLSFVDTPGEPGLRAAASDLCDYVAQCRRWDGRVNTARPLLMVFSEQAARFDTVDGYRDHGWQALQFWHDTDPAPWPPGVHKTPRDPFWSFCYDGMQLFVNMSTPLHHRRKSRNLGRHFTLVINPRERFDIVAGDTPEGRRVRAKIRERSAAYDGMPHSPLLGSYQKGELEWVQYFLPDDEQPDVGRCPFRMRR